VTAIEERAAAPSHRWRARAAYWWIGLTSAAIAVFAPLPYLTSSLQSLGSDETAMAAVYKDLPPWMQMALYVHIIFAALALLLSPAQFSVRLRARLPRLHRVFGRISFVSIGVAGGAGLIMAPVNAAGPIGTVGFGLLAVLWPTFAWNAYRAVRRRDFVEHRRWAIRTFALTYAGVALRLWLGVLIACQAIAGVDSEVAFHRAYYLVPFLAWIPNLIVAERYLARTATTPVPMHQ
jgi:uncharacterized membrane protein